MKAFVLLADDHAIVLDGLNAVLRDFENIEVVAEASTGVQVLDLLSIHRNINTVVLDINMPEMDGLSCARVIKKDYPHVKIIILTMYAQKSFIEEIIKIGVDGCLLKNNSGIELKEAIIRVNSGKSYYDLIHTFDEEQHDIARYKLGERELEIIKLVAEGLTSSQIAEKLFISEHTVKTHRKNILRKTGLHSTTQLIQFALNNRII